MSTQAVTVEGAAGSVIQVDPNAPTHKVEQIQSDASAKAMHDFLERATSITADMGNKVDALLAVQKTQTQTNRHVDSRESYDDVRVMCARSIHELYEARDGGQLFNDVLYVADRMYMEHQMECVRASKAKQHEPPMNKSRLWPVYEGLLKRANIWTPSGTGAGAEWSPTGVSSQRINFYRMPTQLASLFPQITIRKMKQFNLPSMLSAGPVTVLAQTGTTTMPVSGGTANLPGTGVLALAPKKHATPIMAVNMDEIEDSPADILAALTEDSATILTHAQESAIINSQPANSTDLDGTNQGTNTTVLTPANDYATSTTVGYGLRYYAIFAGPTANTQDGGGTKLTLDTWEAGWKKMGRFAFDPSNIFLGTPGVIIDLTSDAAVRSYLNYGPGNPLPIGAVARLHGQPIVPSQNIPNMLATGKVGAAANVFQTGVFCCTSRWRIGSARDIEVKLWDIPGDDHVGIRGFARHGIGNAPPAGATGDPHTVAIINITI